MLELFMKKNCRRLIKKNLQLKEQLKEKEINYTSNGKAMKIILILGLLKRHCVKWVNTFLNHVEVFKEMLKVN